MMRCLVSLPVVFGLLLGSFKPTLVEAADDRKSPVSPADYGKWAVLGAGQLSPDGQWLIHGIVRGDGKERAAGSSRVDGGP